MLRKNVASLFLIKDKKFQNMGVTVIRKPSFRDGEARTIEAPQAPRCHQHLLNVPERKSA